MADYAELVKSLRQCSDGYCVGCKNYYVQVRCRDDLQKEAADAIEELDDICQHQADDLRNHISKWIPVTNGRGGFECDKCHEYAPSYQDGVEYLSHYCPNCGVRMENGW